MLLGANHCVRHCHPDVTMVYHNDITLKKLWVSETLNLTIGHLEGESTGHRWIHLTNEPALRRVDVFCVVWQHAIKQAVQFPIFDMPLSLSHVTEMILQCTGPWSDTVYLLSSFKPTLSHFCVKAEVIPREQSWEVIRMSCVQQQCTKSSHIYILCYFHESTLYEMGYLLQERLTVAAIDSTHQVANDITKAFLQLINPFTGGRQLPTAAITISQHGGRRFRYKFIIAVRAIFKHPFLVLGVCIHRNSMYAFIEHFHLNYMSRLLLLDGGEENSGLMVIYNSQKCRMMVIAPMVWW